MDMKSEMLESLGNQVKISSKNQVTKTTTTDDDARAVHVILVTMSMQPGGIWKRSYISIVTRPTVHTNPSRKRSFSKTLLKLKEFENAGFAFFAVAENILKTKLLENDGV